MAKRPYVNFKELKERIRIMDVLQVLGLTERFKKVGDNLVGVCPLPSHVHGPMPNPEQFKIGRQDGVDVWHCFGDCQRGGDVIEFVKAMTGYDNAHVRLWFAEKFADRLSLQKPGETTSKPVQPTPTVKAMAEPPAPSAAAAPTAAPAEPLKPLKFFLRLDPNAQYLHDRGIYPETVERFGLGQCSKGLLAGYLAIPVRDFPSGNLVAYLGRWAGEDYDEAAGRSRYKWPPNFPAHRVIYGLIQALDSNPGQPLIVVEGPFKVYHLVQNGFPNTVSSFTASLSEEQATILVGTGRPIILFFDGNEAGYKGMRAAAGKLIGRTFVRVVKLPEGKEPDDCSRQELAELLG
jgi:DNA primase